VSRYLLAETAVNLGYSLAGGVGLYFIGIPNALLWGIMYGMLRFLPYVGAWLGSAGPILFSLAISVSWQQPLLVCGLFLVIELIGNNLVEPWVYGSSTGLSPLAIVIAALFWTWLWGAVGLVLATPLTVCAVVVGQHVPRLRFLDVLLSRQPPISNADRIYQRLLAADSDEALELLESESEGRTLAEAFDDLTLPALRAGEAEFQNGVMPAEDRDRFIAVLRQVVIAVGDLEPAEGIEHQSILCLPAASEPDELAALMLQQAARTRGLTVEVPSHRQLIAEMVTSAKERNPVAIVVSIMAPGSALPGASLSHRLRAAMPETFIVAGAWAGSDDTDVRLRARLEKAGVSLVCPTLERTVATLTTVVT
jgi:methylmalonyl-CoA mutase cobalamin-binding subunit